MKFCRSLTGAALIAFTSLSFAQMDTVYLLGGDQSSFEIGWYGEAWKNGNWCGDILVPDANPDTVFTNDTVKNQNINLFPVSDTVILEKPDPKILDSIHLARATITTTKTVVRKTPGDSMVDIITSAKAIYDTSVANNCDKQFRDFISDTGGPFPGASYVNYYYKKRNYWATLPVVWDGWGGKDSVRVSGATSMVIIYQGILPEHQVKLEFRYASWGANKPEIDKLALHMGDGAGILLPTTTWKTVVLPIADSVSLPGITGLDFAIDGGGKTSELGNIKVAMIALLKPIAGIRNAASSRGAMNDHLQFIPKSAGRVMVSFYSLEGRLLGTSSLSVLPANKYSVRNLAKKAGGAASAQIRIVKIQGAGVNLSEKIW